MCGALPGGGGGADRELTVRITRRVGTSDIIVGACYRLPGQEDQADETLCRQIEAASRSQALVLMGASKSVGGTAQQDIGNPGGSWNASMITSFS